MRYFEEASNVSFDGRWADLGPGRPIYLDGLFQSPKYFGSDREGLRSELIGDDLRVKDPVDAVAVGVRLYEEANAGTHDVDPPEFYAVALGNILESASSEDLRVDVFSSDPDQAQKHLGDLAASLHFVTPTRIQAAIHEICDDSRDIATTSSVTVAITGGALGCGSRDQELSALVRDSGIETSTLMAGK